ncbi:hypothetical protein [Paludisphaera rhizosphaerae]|uniref:hypothetical protein n=1 Tax=Paludisphaera rhizosphaerae TaxID=2711216 RepID=UPI0013E9F0DC|nr:hypothetical protein [Paludisphaera rhizosphaerae]
MKSRRTQAYRPLAEQVEERFLTASIADLRAARAEHLAEVRALRANNAALRRLSAHTPGVTMPGANGPTTNVGAGSLGNQGAPTGADSTGNVYYGVVTIKNTTQATVSFNISASTYQGGKFFAFTLKPGKSEVFYAPYGGPLNSAPSFQVSFDSTNRNVTLLADVKTVYASARWTPTNVNLGRPYAIIAGTGYLQVVPT